MQVAAVVDEITVTPAMRQRMHELLSVLGSQQGNKRGKRWSVGHSCMICSRKRHTCKWAMKGTRVSDVSVVTGRWCYCCIKASEKLDVSKNYQVLLAMPELLELVRQKSAKLALELSTYDGDTCFCKICAPSAINPETLDAADQKMPPLKRLRSKTAV